MQKPDVNVLLLAVIGCGLSCFSGSFETAIASGPAPNVILMMADDMGMGDTSAYQDFTGNQDAEQLPTPNMNRLARMGVRFTDAHTPASRCTLTRYALLTGRYSWRNRLKHWVLFGVQGDPMIESDRPTLGTLFQSHGYRTGLVGKWHVGLRYRQSDGQPADGWEDADLTQPMFDTPLDHGFDYCRFTSRSHGTSGPAKRGKKMPNNAFQSIGPGHIHGRTIIGATGDGKRLTDRGENAYVLEELGSRHLANAKSFLSEHLADNQDAPFFLYYACNSNHGPHTPEKEIEGVSVAGAGISVSMKPLGTRADYVYENDVVLGSLMNYLKSENDPRNPGKKLIENTIVIFTSDHGYHMGEHGHWQKTTLFENAARVPLIMAGPGIATGHDASSIAEMVDLYPTLADLAGIDPPRFTSGISLKDGLIDPGKAPRTAALTQYENGYSIRTHRYRYTEWGEQGSDGKELYDHQSDTAEMHNLAEHQDQRQTISRLAELLQRRVQGARQPPAGIQQIHFENKRKVPQR